MSEINRSPNIDRLELFKEYIANGPERIYGNIVLGSIADFEAEQALNEHQADSPKPDQEHDHA
ncbi:MAG: hypothetical protein NVS1B10_05600 [Candidatus Saccharimonadales bacterium]